MRSILRFIAPHSIRCRTHVMTIGSTNIGVSIVQCVLYHYRYRHRHRHRHGDVDIAAVDYRLYVCARSVESANPLTGGAPPWPLCEAQHGTIDCDGHGLWHQCKCKRKDRRRSRSSTSRGRGRGSSESSSSSSDGMQRKERVILI